MLKKFLSSICVALFVIGVSGCSKADSPADDAAAAAGEAVEAAGEAVEAAADAVEDAAK